MNLFTSNEVKIKLNYNHIWIDHPLFVKLLVNDRVLNFDISGEPNKNIEKKLNLDNELHELKIQITGKNDQNTSIDQQGKIIQDSFIEITDLQFDNISVLNMLKKMKQILECLFQMIKIFLQKQPILDTTAH